MTTFGVLKIDPAKLQYWGLDGARESKPSTATGKSNYSKLLFMISVHEVEILFGLPRSERLLPPTSQRAQQQHFEAKLQDEQQLSSKLAARACSIPFRIHPSLPGGTSFPQLDSSVSPGFE
jgi:hypothetical protein